jgi:glycerol-3-phosphate dehydrogenase
MTGNTCGTGTTEEYTGIQMLDAALLNRVFMVEIDYDRNIEEAIAGEEMKDVVDFVHDLRDAAKAANILIVVSYRNIKQLRQLCNVVGIDTLIQGCITKGMGKDEINILYNGLNDKYSRWAKALKNAA